MGLEIIRVIASLCMIAAGDNPSIGTMAGIIDERQAQCQKHFANCLPEKPTVIDFYKCMQIRKP
jgi:hypothetical protein